MTQLLEQAMSEVQKLPESEQDALAQQILEGLSDRQWDALFARPESESLLSRLAAEARAEITVPTRNGGLDV